MEELDLKQLIGIFWSRKLEIILIVAILVVIGVIYTMAFTTPMYSSATTLLLASSNSSNQGGDAITTTDLTLNSKLVSTYSELVKIKNVLREVIDNLQIEINEDELRNNVKVTSVEDTELIKISVTTKEAEVAPKIANEIAKVFIEKVKGFYNIENVQVVDEAEINNAPSNINHKKDVIIFAFIGVVLAVIYVLIANMLDTTIKTSEEVEKEFKLPVLASIPVYNTDLQKLKGRGGRR